MEDASVLPSSTLTRVQRLGMKLLRIQVWLVIAVVLFLGLNQWARWCLDHSGGLEEPEEQFWLESDTYPSAPWLKDYVAEFQRSRLKWKPYLYWQRKPMSGRYINVDGEGRRLTFSSENAVCTGRVVVVCMFGGSTMWGEGVRDGHTVPSEVQRLLREAGINAKVVNEGEGGYVSTQEMIKFLLLVREGRTPDAAVFLDGLNDSYSAWENKAAGIPQNECNRVKDFNLSSNPIRMAKVALAGGQRGWSIFRYLHQRINRSGGGIATSLDTNRTEAVARDAWQLYEQNVRFIRAVAGTAGVRTLFFWQPSILEKQTATAFEERIRGLQPPDEKAVCLRTYEIAARACAEKPDLGIHDVSHCFDEVSGPRFMDIFHLNEQGNAELAAEIVKELLTLLRSADSPSKGR